MNTKPLPWQESAPLVHIVLPVKNGPLPAELKFRGNFEYAMCYFIKLNFQENLLLFSFVSMNLQCK